MNEPHTLTQRARRTGLALLAAVLLVTGYAWRGLAEGPQPASTRAATITIPIAHAVADTGSGTISEL